MLNIIDAKKNIFSYINTINQLITEYFNEINLKINDSKSFNGLIDIELITDKLTKNILHQNSLLLSDILSNIDEKIIIKQVKNIYKEKGITLRTNRRYPITIATKAGECTFQRYVLRPKTKDDYRRLAELEGKTAIIPKDDFLKISSLPGRLSVPAMLEVAKWAQNQASYKRAEEVVKNECGIDVGSVTIMNVTNTVGGIAFKNDLERAKEAYKLFDDGKLNLDPPTLNGVFYIEADGAMFNTRGKNDDGSSWCENKLGEVFSTADFYYWKSKKGKKRRKLIKKEYTCYVGKSSEFKKFLFACALRNGYGKFKQTVLLSDGATWIREMKNELFYDAQQILDFFHLSEKLNDFGKIYFNSDITKYKPWAEKTCAQFKAGQYKEAIKMLAKMENSLKNKKDAIKIVQYLENNINNIDYADYEKKGYIIGSGAIESGNKTVLAHRLKQAGMRWNKESAQNILTLRAKVESNLWYEDVAIPVRKHFGILANV
jgi:hypothetical protein